MNFDWLLDSGYVPHPVIRIGIRRLLAQRLSSLQSTSEAESCAKKLEYVKLLRSRPIAIQTQKANEQHYEVGTGVLGGCLGTRMKYSSCLYPTGKETLDEAEVAMLESYITKAELKDGQMILDLGCGWGSASIFLAEKFPNSKVTGFSNSRTQKTHIDGVAAAKGLNNLTIITGDVVDYEFEHGVYDRVVSIELFEHMKNYQLLMAKVARALKPGGKLFVHIFTITASLLPYDFESEAPEDASGKKATSDWMSEYFFTGGTMPSADLLHWFQDDLRLKSQWWVSGKHYAQTCEDWLKKMNAHKKEIWPSLEETYGKENAVTWYARWEIFYMACAELFAYQGGDTWGVSHYLFEKPTN